MHKKPCSNKMRSRTVTADSIGEVSHASVAVAVRVDESHSQGAQYVCTMTDCRLTATDAMLVSAVGASVSTLSDGKSIRDDMLTVQGITVVKGAAVAFSG